MMQLLLGNSVRLGEAQLPRIWSAHRAAYTTLDIASVPNSFLHIIQTPVANAVTIGAQRPTVLLQSGIVPMLDETELRAVLAHEAGHVLSEHVRYRTTLELLLRFTLPRMPLMGRVPLQALIAALLAWYRAAELSCDRAAAIALRDPLPTCRALMKLAGGGAEGLSLDAFIQQADEYVEWDDLFDRHQRLGSELGSTHPFPVRRVYELTRWVKSGEYDRIMAGDYVRRGEEPPPSAGSARRWITTPSASASSWSGVRAASTRCRSSSPGGWSCSPTTPTGTTRADRGGPGAAGLPRAPGLSRRRWPVM